MNSCIPLFNATLLAVFQQSAQNVRSGSSSFWAIGDVEPGLQRLKRDLESGEWARRHAGLLTLDACDAGYRLVVAD